MTNTRDTSADDLRGTVGGEVRAWLGRRNLSQSDLARHLGIARGAVNLRITGKRDFTLVELADTAAWLGITLAELLGPEILETRRSPHTELVGAGASEKLLRLDSNQQPFD
uniref:helix-turn-helix transcriptional regulator n=1 Tax=uncultured Micrococcus sp. TaxID=114051 RepID=UPI00341CEC5E